MSVTLTQRKQYTCLDLPALSQHGLVCSILYYVFKIKAPTFKPSHSRICILSDHLSERTHSKNDFNQLCVHENRVTNRYCLEHLGSNLHGKCDLETHCKNNEVNIPRDKCYS